MRWLPTVLSFVAAALVGAAMAVVLHARPAFDHLWAAITGEGAYQRCVKAGACSAVQGAPRAPRRLQAPPDLDRA